jgi:hypothetical protein
MIREDFLVYYIIITMFTHIGSGINVDIKQRLNVFQASEVIMGVIVVYTGHTF